MKNGLLIWNVMLTLLTGFLLFKQLGNNKSANNKKTVTTDTSVVSKPASIAYFEMDSVEAKFDIVKKFKAELSKKETEIATETEKMTTAMQNRYTYFQKEQEQGKLTQEQAEAAGNEIKSMEQNLKLRREQLEREYSGILATGETDIKSKLESFIKDFNKNKGFSYIFSNEPGLFYYRDTTYNITKEVIKGLNERYKPVK